LPPDNATLPHSEAGRRQHAALIGADGQQLLQAIDHAVEQSWLQQVPAVRLLRQVWAEQYVTEAGGLRWREVKEIPTPAELICSPQDPEARYSTKRDLEWVGAYIGDVPGWR
jgi:hypothetical protein